jgi:hypothetical protein
MGNNTRRTSNKVASTAGAVLANPAASATAKSLAASALSQTGTKRQTGADMEDKAARVLASEKYSDQTKTLAASVLSQSNKAR